jgi:hypothetical protein
MTRTERYWVTVLVVLLIIGFLYGKIVYDSFFESQAGYIYDPETDRIFSVELKPSIDHSEKWTPLIPFKSFYFGEIGLTEYLGKLTPLIKEIEAEQKLIKEDPLVFVEKTRKEFEALIADYESGNLDLWDIKYFPKWDLNPKGLLPSQLINLKEFIRNEPPDIFVADVIVAHWRLKAMKEKPAAETELIRKVLFIRGKAAYQLAKRGFPSTVI